MLKEVILLLMAKEVVLLRSRPREKLLRSLEVSAYILRFASCLISAFYSILQSQAFSELKTFISQITYRLKAPYCL